MNENVPSLVLHQDLKRRGNRFVTTDDNVDLQAMRTLVHEGLAVEIDDGLWMVLERERPEFDVPRFWSNPDLQDPVAICALVASKPTIEDVTSAILAYGIAAMRKGVAECVGEINPKTVDTAADMVENAWRGIGNAARRHAAA